MTIQQRLFAWALAAALLVGSGWWAWRWYTTPAPPELSFGHMDPAVAEAVQTALDEVRREPRSGAARGRLALVMAAHSYRDQALEVFCHAAPLDSQDPRR